MNILTSIQPANKVSRMILSIIFAVFVMSSLSLIANAQPAFACPAGQICAGTGTGTSGTPPGAQTGSPAQNINNAGGTFINPGSPPAPTVPWPGVGVGVSSLSKTWTQTGSTASCAVRNDGKRALQAIHTFGYYLLENVSGVNPGPGWTEIYRTQQGTYGYEKTALISIACKYPPRVYYTTVRCSISQSVEAFQVAPNRKTLSGPLTTGTGYAENAGSLAACNNAYGNVYMNKSITEYGFYDIYTWQRMQAVRVEVAYTPNEVTGVTPAPKIISRSPAYNTSRFRAQTASLDCEYGFRSPGVSRSDWTETPCQTIGRPTYVCVQQPIQFDAGEGSTTTMRASTSGSIQFLRDGKARKTVFNQTPQGSGISINTSRYKTTFFRAEDSTPWNSSALYNKNQFDLSLNATGQSILSNSKGTSSPTYNGKVDNTWFTGIQSSESGKPTKITQRVNWAGSRTIRSGTITSINANTGAVSWSPINVTVPTSGICNQVASVDYIRPIGDVVR